MKRYLVDWSYGTGVHMHDVDDEENSEGIDYMEFGDVVRADTAQELYDALNNLARAYRNIAGLDGAFDKELQIAEHVLAKHKDEK